MSAKAEFTVPGNPIPKARPRVVRGRACTAKRTSDYERLVRVFAKMSWRDEPMTGSIALTLRFFRETAHRCDLDNLVKSVCDALQRVVFEDDSQVVLLLAEKSIDRDAPRVEILVEAVR